MKLIVASHEFVTAPKVYIVKPVSRGTWAQRTTVCCGKLFISFSSLSYDRSKASSKANSTHSAIYGFLLPPLLSLRSSSSFLRLLLRLPLTAIPPFIFLSITHLHLQSRKYGVLKIQTSCTSIKLNFLAKE